MNKDFFNKELSKIIIDIDTFKNTEAVNYIKIQNIALSEFTTPTFNKSGEFSEGPRGFRNEYEKIVQPLLLPPSHRKNPCIYIFEVLNSESNVRNRYINFIKAQETSINKRKYSSINLHKKKNIKNCDSKILYVGKSEKPIDGRIVVHFGYYEKGVAGLQLAYWAKDIKLELNLHVFEFVDKNLHQHLEVIEKLFFVQLNPIIGKR